MATFNFFYTDKAYAAKLREAADVLEATGRCELGVDMSAPRDLAGLAAWDLAMGIFDEGVKAAGGATNGR